MFSDTVLVMQLKYVMEYYFNFYPRLGVVLTQFGV